MTRTDANPAFGPTEHAKMGMFGVAQGSEFDGYAKFRAIFGNLGKPPNEAMLDLRDLQNRTRDQ